MITLSLTLGALSLAGLSLVTLFAWSWLFSDWRNT